MALAESRTAIMLLDWRRLVLLVCVVWAHANAQSGFVRQDGKYLVTPANSRLLLRGINLGNWLEPEGYMFLLEGGPAAPREIEGFFNELSKRRDVATVVCAKTKRDAAELLRIHRRPVFVCGRITARSASVELGGIRVLKLPEDTRTALKLIG